ncbi:MAG: UTP--glucose-1-phosphate uridylyltransferase, partial [Candidatus Cloacimonetes bacterium]|nr:UTP--glucose-1-phosphate uridylyltransferase [Candidatus Cloacimonadota bacterium]
IPVFQLESAMGAAISVFPGARALVVRRDRFIPVKKTNDLLSVWSNVYELDNKYNLRLNKNLKKAPMIALDDNYYKTIEQLKYHFPYGAPALKDCNSFVVKGEIFFGKGIKCSGDVIIESSGRLKIEDRILTGHIRL